MKVHRFIGLSEIQALLRDGIVKPLQENGRRCLYFFDSEEHPSPAYQLEYVSGIVGELESDSNNYRYFCLIRCDIPEKHFVKSVEPYADPEGGWFDKIGVEELHLFGEYRKEAVKAVELYIDHYFQYKMHSSYNTVEEAYEFLKSKNVD